MVLIYFRFLKLLEISVNPSQSNSSRDFIDLIWENESGKEVIFNDKSLIYLIYLIWLKDVFMLVRLLQYEILKVFSLCKLLKELKISLTPHPEILSNSIYLWLLNDDEKSANAGQSYISRLFIDLSNPIDLFIYFKPHFDILTFLIYFIASKAPEIFVSKEESEI